MRTLKKKVWAGLALNLATLFIGIWDFGVQDGLNTAVSGLAIAMILSFLLSVTGVVMLLRGKASGGIIAVAGSLIFVPAGLICMLGSLQSRADILREGLTPSSTPPVAPRRKTQPDSSRGTERLNRGRSRPPRRNPVKRRRLPGGFLIRPEFPSL